MRQAVILAGGLGTRLAARLGDLPKALVDVDGEPLLGRQLRLLQAHGFTDVLLLVNHRKEAIEAFLRQVPFAGLRVEVIEDGEARGTAGAVMAAGAHLSERFLVVYGDTLLDVDLTAFWEAHLAAGAEGTLFLHPNDHPHDSDLVAIDEARRVRAFLPKPHPAGSYRRNLVNAALYVLEKRLVMAYRPGPGLSDFGADLFPALLKAGHSLHAYVSFEYIKDIGTPERLDRAVGDLRSGKVARARLDVPQQAVFLDRDGTLNHDSGHIARTEDLLLLPGVPAAVRALNRHEFRCIVVTNQPVLARGEASAADMEQIHARLETLLGQEGAYLDALYLCPHHPDAGFAGEVAALKIRCACRKPGTGMIDRARHDFRIDPTRSWIVGDRTADIEAGRRSGLTTILLQTGAGGGDRHCDVIPDFEVADLPEAAWLITQGHGALLALLAPVLDRVNAGALVTISGQGRAGKSLVGALLRLGLRQRGRGAVSLSLDRWLKAESARPAAGTVEDRYDLSAATTCLAPWLDGGTLEARLPVYDRIARAPVASANHVRIEAEDVLLLDGVIAHRLAAPGRPRLRLFVRVDEAERVARLEKEYITFRGMDRAAFDALYRARVDDEIPLVDAARATSDWCVDLSAMTLEGMP
jgi:histidinol-phosphate phosphatase family protein